MAQDLQIPHEIAKEWSIITRGVEEIIQPTELIQLLLQSKKTGKPLRVKVGFDPTGSRVHLGWSVMLRKMRHFQDLGHQVIFLFGSFTAMIGDPTGRKTTRPQLTREEVLGYAHELEDQVFQILDRDRTEVRFNSEWCEGMSFADVIKLAGKYTVARMLERDDFTLRYRAGEPISLHEFLYPLVQGYDSVVLQSDIELGATEQRFNLLVGRDMQRAWEQQPQVVLMMPILVGTDGVEKMSQSKDNHIGISEHPREMFGKLMSIPDEQIVPYFTLLTDIDQHDIETLDSAMRRGELNPRDAKARLAGMLVTMYHDAEAAQLAAEEFNRMFRDKGLPNEMPQWTAVTRQPVSLVELIVNNQLAASNSAARRLIRDGAVAIDGEKIQDIEHQVQPGPDRILKAGKRGFLKVRFP